MRFSEIQEDVDLDIDMSRRASKAASIVTHAIYDGVPMDHFIELEGHGEFFVWSAVSLGLAKEFPEMASVCVLLGKKNPKAVGLSGACYFFKPPLFDFKQGIVIECLSEMKKSKVIPAVCSTSFLNVIDHEFLHLLDGFRNPKILSGTRYKNGSENSYYNDPAEFNAYFHDLVNMLVGVIEGGKDAKDYAELYGFTGDFLQDFKSMTNQDIYTRKFVKSLTPARRKALLKRVYRLHQEAKRAVEASASRADQGSGSDADEAA